MRKAVLISVLMILVQFALAFYFSPLMPERMAIHWNLQGEADGYGSRLVGSFLIPVIETILLPLFLVLPRIDPKGSSDKLVETYEWFILVFTGYMFYVFGLSIAWNFGYRFDFMRLLVPVLGVLFYGIGVLMGRVEMNWFLGIRTPWTLSSREVWDETHRVGSRLFKACGVVSLFGLLFGGWVSLALVVVPILVSGIYLFYFSYREYSQKQNTSIEFKREN
jgi:uncharacterized membrane protein